MRLRFHTQTAGSTLTAQQPDNNVVRVTLQALAAVLGGTQSLHTNSKDEALGLPTEHAATLALRTQQILAFESGVTDTVDPLGGAPFVEAMTDALEDAARTYLKRIDALGGAVPAIEQGFIQGEIHKAAYQHQLAVEKGDTIVVGVNKFTAEEPHADIFRVKDTLRATRIREVEDARKRRDASAAKRTLDDVVRVAQSKQNLLPALVAAVEAGVTLGELCTALEALFGRYRAPVL
jgi:methylmalonyl-CoA mutase N-terminal domain/subunit